MSPEAAIELQRGSGEGHDIVIECSGAPKKRAAMAFAACALLIWSTLAVSVVSISDLSPLLTTGVGLAGGGLVGLPWVAWGKLKLRPVLVGTLAMLGYHALYFLSLKTADPVAANLLHYLWPIFIILLSPLMLRGHRLMRKHLWAGALGFIGAAACLGPVTSISSSAWVGFGLALLSAAIWAYYSVWSRRYPEVPTATVSLYCLLAGIASLVAFVVIQFDPSKASLGMANMLQSPSLEQWMTLAYLALGPLGGAFYLWDHAMKKGNPHEIAVLAYAVPVASTLFVSLFLGRGLNAATIAGAVLVTLAVAVGNRARQGNRTN
ncbi:DMT family transporter [Cupriavidus sp. IDO]|uniref:DMT family transporter n=1 Tax=Cupriavidus sp. IDO TaxID=1539142 RepID=UPI000A58A04E|nr:DMT family transporter [Cupriavidus sp. IDO]